MPIVRRPALFLDRDGVINVDHGYVYESKKFEFVDGIFDLCRQANARGYWIFVVTNQAGIGRGLYTEEDFLKLTEWMCGKFAEHGAPIGKVYFCPFHPVHGIGKYRVDSPFRKPGPGMIFDAAAEFDVDLKNSVLLGDKISDIKAGIAANVGCNLLLRSQDQPLDVNQDLSAFTVIHKIADAVQFLAFSLPDP